MSNAITKTRLDGLGPLRIKNLLTQGELGKAIGRSGGFISALENGHRNAGLKTLRKLCEALSCTVDDLLTPPQEAGENG